MSLIPFILDLADELHDYNNRCYLANAAVAAGGRMDVDDFGFGIYPHEMQQQRPHSPTSTSSSSSQPPRRARSLSQLFWLPPASPPSPPSSLLGSASRQRPHPYRTVRHCCGKAAAANAAAVAAAAAATEAQLIEAGAASTASARTALLASKTPSYSLMNKNGFQVSMNVKHFTVEELSVKTVEQCIVVEGEHGEKEDGHGVISRHFIRKYTLPKGFDADEVDATLSSDGILTVRAPSPPTQKLNTLAERVVRIRQQSGQWSSPAVAVNVKPQSQPEVQQPRAAQPKTAQPKAAKSANPKVVDAVAEEEQLEDVVVVINSSGTKCVAPVSESVEKCANMAIEKTLQENSQSVSKNSTDGASTSNANAGNVVVAAAANNNKPIAMVGVVVEAGGEETTTAVVENVNAATTNNNNSNSNNNNIPNSSSNNAANINNNNETAAENIGNGIPDATGKSNEVTAENGAGSNVGAVAVAEGGDGGDGDDDMQGGGAGAGIKGEVKVAGVAVGLETVAVGDAPQTAAMDLVAATKMQPQQQQEAQKQSQQQEAQQQPQHCENGNGAATTVEAAGVGVGAITSIAVAAAGGGDAME